MWNTKACRIQVKLNLTRESSSISNNWQLCCLRTPGLPGGIYIVQLFIPAESVAQRPLLANSGRMLLWSKSMALGFNHPLLGVGELNALYYLRDYPHNIVLTVFVQWGVFGLVIFLLVALRSFIKSCELIK